MHLGIETVEQCPVALELRFGCLELQAPLPHLLSATAAAPRDMKRHGLVIHTNFGAKIAAELCTQSAADRRSSTGWRGAAR